MTNSAYLDGLKKKSVFGIYRELVGEISGRRRHLYVKVVGIDHFSKFREGLKSHHGILKTKKYFLDIHFN